MLEQIGLDQAGVDHIRKELAKGGEISGLLLKLDLEHGNSYTFVPEGMLSIDSDLNESIEYLTGNNVTEDVTKLVIQIIEDYLKDDQSHIAISETIWNSNDPFITKLDVNHISLLSRVFLYLENSSNREKISEFLRESIYYPTIIVLLNRMLNAVEVSPSTLELIAADQLNLLVDYLIIGAFDGEGFVIWSR